MDSYALYNFTYCPVEAIQGDLFISQDVKVDMSTEDKNLWLDRIFGDRNADVRIQRIKKMVKEPKSSPVKYWPMVRDEWYGCDWRMRK